MKKTAIGISLMLSFIVLVSSFSRPAEPVAYTADYKARVIRFREAQIQLLEQIKNSNSNAGQDLAILTDKISEVRLKLKELDFWFRYFEPIAYKKINGPLPVEWETEVFEKFEPPYKREGAGLTLAAVYLEEEDFQKDSLLNLIETSIQSTGIFLEDSVTKNLNTYHHFFLANRLFLLNLAAIYTTGFECPDTANVVPELRYMLSSVRNIYLTFQQNFPDHQLSDEYLDHYEKMIGFVQRQPDAYSTFDHFNFIQQFVNPLYHLNHSMILDYKVKSSNFNDFSLNKYAASIFDKSLYRGQNGKGVFIGIDDPLQLEELRQTGKLLFYDPILSGNNKRSCASCHNPATFFTDTLLAKHSSFDQQQLLSRNTPSLVNVLSNHLIMQDGKHINLENQCRDVITNPKEMGGDEEEILKKILSCDDYKSVFKKYLKATPQYKTINMEHVASAIMLYYSGFSSYDAPFDRAINKKEAVPADIKNGFNLFMSKAQCATCHFVPQFNGTKPPYIGSEFEVIGVPSDMTFTSLSEDKGRYQINPAKETFHAFRTGTVRNAAHTMPYMHNGVFKTLEQVIDFYDAGGGAGRGLAVNNQTLSSDSLKLSGNEKKDIIAFINSLTEDLPLEVPPAKLPSSKNKALNNRTVGGEY